MHGVVDSGFSRALECWLGKLSPNAIPTDVGYVRGKTLEDTAGLSPGLIPCAVRAGLAVGVGPAAAAGEIKG